ncbi:MAG TPA: RodZ domain-containing protein [Chloroflexota bacterium]
METLGALLREARQERGISLGQVERDTHIRRKYLEALEHDEYSALPPPVYTQGIVRTYAQYLGLDPTYALSLYTPQRHATRDQYLVQAVTPLRTSPSIPLGTVLVGVCAFALVGLFVYLYVLYTAVARSVETLGEAPAATRSSEQSQGPPAGQPPPDATLQATPPALQPTGPVLPVATPEPTATPVPTPRPTPTPTPIEGLIVEARVVERSWIEVWVDGQEESIFAANVPANTTEVFEAERELRMRVGNAAGVIVTVNGRLQGPLGARGQVVDARWTR